MVLSRMSVVMGESYRAASCSRPDDELAQRTLTFQGRTLTFQGRTLTFQGRTLTFQGQTLTFQGRTLTFQGPTLTFQSRALPFQASAFRRSPSTLAAASWTLCRLLQLDLRRAELHQLRTSCRRRPGRTTVLSSLPRHQHGRREIPRRIQHRREQVRNGVDGDEDADPFRRQADGQEERREHDERAAGDAGGGEGEEDGRESDR